MPTITHPLSDFAGPVDLPKLLTVIRGAVPTLGATGAVLRCGTDPQVTITVTQEPTDANLAAVGEIVSAHTGGPEIPPGFVGELATAGGG